MEYRSIVSVPINPITSSISVSPYGKNKSKNSSVNRKNKYINNRILNSIDNDEDNDYKNNLLLKEKNTIIQKLQKQINILMTKEEEKDYLERKEKENAGEERKREEIRKEWRQIWREIWIPDIKESVDPDIVMKRKLMICSLLSFFTFR